MKMAKQIGWLVLLFLLTLGAKTSAVSVPQADPFVWDAVEKKADLPGMTNVAYFMFWVTNTSAAEATIVSTETTCDCTVAEAASKLPWVIKPGESGWMRILVNTKGKYGLVTKTATIHTSYGMQILTVSMNIPISPAPFAVSIRKQDRMAAQQDRQAVFSEHCAACHKYPAGGRTGEGLFSTACGICHLAEIRAEMVPDLSQLKHATSADFWRTTITFGKPGTLMPAFANAQGGILDSNQIESLVQFLVKKFPSHDPAVQPANAPASSAK
jgi:cytochrome c5